MNCSKLLANAMRRSIGTAVIGVALTAAAGAAQERPQAPAVNPHAAAIKGFLDRTNDYIELQKKVDNGLPKLTGDDDPSEIEAHQAAMAGRIKLARSAARPGDIFGSAAAVIKGVIREDAHLRSLRDARAAMEEVPKYDPPRVNAAYPEKSPLATVPPLILNALPRLPEGLEYRFMGNDLILRDTKANLIADFMNGAVPTANRK
jgi:hypothetical protein